MTPRKDNTRDERGVAIMYVAMFLLSSIWLVSNNCKLTSSVSPNNGTPVPNSFPTTVRYSSSTTPAVINRL